MNIEDIKVIKVGLKGSSFIEINEIGFWINAEPSKALSAGEIKPEIHIAYNLHKICAKVPALPMGSGLDASEASQFRAGRKHMAKLCEYAQKGIDLSQYGINDSCALTSELAANVISQVEQYRLNQKIKQNEIDFKNCIYGWKGLLYSCGDHIDESGLCVDLRRGDMVRWQGQSRKNKDQYIIGKIENWREEGPDGGTLTIRINKGFSFDWFSWNAMPIMQIATKLRPGQKYRLAVPWNWSKYGGWEPKNHKKEFDDFNAGGIAGEGMVQIKEEKKVKKQKIKDNLKIINGGKV